MEKVNFVLRVCVHSDDLSAGLGVNVLCSLYRSRSLASCVVLGTCVIERNELAG